MIEVCSERLVIRKFNLDDVNFIIELLNDETFIKNIADKNVRSADDAHRYLQEGPFTSYREFGFGLGLVALKKCGTPIGMCGLLKRIELPHPDLGYAILPQFCGKGYAFEAANSVLLAAKNDYKLEKVLAITSPENIRSNKLLKKLQFKKIGKLELYGLWNNEYLLEMKT